MALGSIINALWDAWGKVEKKPMWKLLVNMPPQMIVDAIDWRYMEDALTKDEALEILNERLDEHHALEIAIQEKGPKAYSTAGWLGLTDEEISETIKDMQAQGFDCFKMKVGQNLDDDRERLSFIRSIIGYKSKLMVDCNQVWGVDDAIEYMSKLKDFIPIWIEEPTARDDVQGHIKISKALKAFDIKVAAGEQVPSPVIFKQLLQSGAIGYCQIDASRLGGVNDVLAVILLAKKFEVPVCPHGGGIGLCNMIVHYAIWDQIKVASHSKDQVVEYIEFLQDEVFINPIQINDGHYVTPKSFGWGLEMHSNFFNSHIYPTGEIWKGRIASGSVTFLP